MPNLPHRRDVQRARSACDLTRRLIDVFNRWAAWLDQWETTGDADPTVPLELQTEALACFISLWSYGINSGSFISDGDQSAEYLRGLLPPLPNPSESPEWRQDLDLRRQVRARLNSQPLIDFLYELNVILKRLEIDPSSAFIEFLDPRGASPHQDQPGGQPKPRGKRKGRPTDTDLKKDERIFSKWNAREFSSYADFALKHNMKEREVRHAVDRHRQRIQRAGQKNPDK
jgi:hypothetical protein